MFVLLMFPNQKIIELVSNLCLIAMSGEYGYQTFTAQEGSAKQPTIVFIATTRQCIPKVFSNWTRDEMEMQDLRGFLAEDLLQMYQVPYELEIALYVALYRVHDNVLLTPAVIPPT